NWPGNVRKLQNCIERAVALTRFKEITLDDLPEKIKEHRTPAVIDESEHGLELLSIDEVERRYVLRVLQAVGGNKTQAAHVLGFDRKPLYQKWERTAQQPGPPTGAPRPPPGKASLSR